MGIFLSILKVIGIILLCILAFVLFLVILILVCPINYRGDARFEEKADAHVKVGWMFFIRFYLDVKDNKPDYAAKLFGIRVFPKKKKEEKEDEHLFSEAKSEAEDKKTDEKDADSVKKAEEKTGEKTEKKTGEKTEIAEASGNEEEQEEKTPLIEKIENLAEKVIHIWDNTTCALADEKSVLFRFISRKSTKNSLIWTKDFLIKVLWHIRPRKLKGSLELGLDDPATTGYIFAALSQFYDAYYENFELTPEFEEKTIKGELELKGHIVLGYIVMKALRLYLRKQFRQFLKNAKGLKNDTMKNIEKIKDGITNYG